MKRRSITAVRSAFAITGIALTLGLAIAQPVDAKGKLPPMADRQASQNSNCTLGGGTTGGHIEDGGSKTVTTCGGGVMDGLTCTNTRTSTHCTQSNLVVQPGTTTFGNANPVTISTNHFAPTTPQANVEQVTDAVILVEPSPTAEPTYVAAAPVQTDAVSVSLSDEPALVEPAAIEVVSVQLPPLEQTAP